MNLEEKRDEKQEKDKQEKDKQEQIAEKIKDQQKELIVICPHCEWPVSIEKLNCQIFRHGSLISNGRQMDPHLSKEKCDYLIVNKLINGCGKPFFVKQDENGIWVAEECDYI